MKNLKKEVGKAPPDFNRLVEYSPNAYGPAEPGAKQKAAEKAKA